MEKRIALESKCLHMMNPSLRIDQNKLYSIKLTRSNILETGSLELTKKKMQMKQLTIFGHKASTLSPECLKTFKGGRDCSHKFPQSKISHDLCCLSKRYN